MKHVVVSGDGDAVHWVGWPMNTPEEAISGIHLRRQNNWRNQPNLDGSLNWMMSSRPQTGKLGLIIFVKNKP